MMQSCGICFEHRRIELDDETEYIAPDLLPDRTELQVELDQKWGPDEPAEAAVFEYAMLHPGLMRSVISRIGQQAGLDALYWKGGVYVYGTQTKSRGLIEQEMIDDRRGRIHVQTQRGQAADLLRRLMALVEEEQNRAGMTPRAVTTTACAEAIASGATRTAEPSQEPKKKVFAQEPSPAPEVVCVLRLGR
jgi:internalin A